jgi:ABC-type amino acid transport substrate-binding protein
MSGCRARPLRRGTAGGSRAARAGAAVVAVLAAASALTGCGLQVPADPDGTLERITGGQLRVGASPSGDLVVLQGGDVEGSLAELVEGFAEERDAEVVWTVDSEEDLVADLVAGRLDLAIGGMTAATPWSAQVAATRGYPGIADSDGADVAVLLPLGENALQSALETYLDREVAR